MALEYERTDREHQNGGRRHSQERGPVRARAHALFRKEELAESEIRTHDDKTQDSTLAASGAEHFVGNARHDERQESQHDREHNSTTAH